MKQASHSSLEEKTFDYLEWLTRRIKQDREQRGDRMTFERWCSRCEAWIGPDIEKHYVVYHQEKEE